MRRTFFLLFACLVLVALASACGGDESQSTTSGGGTGGASVSKTTGNVVVGVTTDLRIGTDIDRLHVVMRAGNEVIRDETLDASAASADAKLAFPLELGFEHRPKDEPLTITLDAFNPVDHTTPVVHRIASTYVLAGKTLLLRVALHARCEALPGSMAPACVEPETCVSGVCVSSYVDAKTLPDYSPGWSKVSTDVCKPGEGAAIVLVGEGQADYLPTMDGDVAQVEAGPQGGHHVWIAIRVKNLTQSGSITKVEGHVDGVGDGGVDVGPFQVIFTFEQDEGGYCKLYGLRFQIDEMHPVEELLGKTMTVKVTVTDKDGDVGVGTRVIKLSDSFI